MLRIHSKVGSNTNNDYAHTMVMNKVIKGEAIELFYINYSFLRHTVQHPLSTSKVEIPVGPN